MMVEPFVEVCKRRGLKVDKGKMMVLRGEEGRYVKSLGVGDNWSIYRSLSNFGLCSINQVQIEWNVIGKWKVWG